MQRALADRPLARDGKLHVAAVGLVVLLAVIMGAPGVGQKTAAAQQAAHASSGGEAEKSLARRALDCLDRGEDAIGKESKLAAYREGVALAQRAVQADETNADAHFALFATDARIIQLEGTVNPFTVLKVNRELDRVLELDPNHTDGLAARGGMYRQLPWVLGGSLKKAEEYLNRAVALDPDALGSRIELAETYRAMGHPDRSIPLLQKAMEVAERKDKPRQLNEARELLDQLSRASSR
jgi:FimV-like protein